MQITIGRAKRGIGSLLPGQAYVGRPSVLGNPFVVGRDGSCWLGRQLGSWSWCWCHPLPCHAEVVRSALLWLTGEEGAAEEAGSVEGA